MYYKEFYQKNQSVFVTRIAMMGMAFCLVLHVKF